jgi:hypothetical protein
VTNGSWRLQPPSQCNICQKRDTSRARLQEKQDRHCVCHDVSSTTQCLKLYLVQTSIEAELVGQRTSFVMDGTAPRLNATICP